MVNSAPASPFSWARLNHLQVGRYAEYFVKMELTLHGFEVFTSEVDDRGVDFVMRRNGGSFYDVQVKSVRGYNTVFVRKNNFQLAPHRLLAVVILHEGHAPELYLLPMEAWNSPNELLVSRDYIGKKSEPEWGLNLSAKNQHILDAYAFSKTVATLI